MSIKNYFGLYTIGRPNGCWLTIHCGINPYQVHPLHLTCIQCIDTNKSDKSNFPREPRSLGQNINAKLGQPNRIGRFTEQKRSLFNFVEQIRINIEVFDFIRNVYLKWVTRIGCKIILLLDVFSLRRN